MSRKQKPEERPGTKHRARRDSSPTTAPTASEPASGPPPSSPRRFSDALEGPRGVIPAGMSLRGDLKGEGHLEVQGEMVGEISTVGLVLIGAEGKFQGDLSATGVVVEGRLAGKIAATEKVELRANCRVQADIQAKAVAIAEGCFFEGKIHMLGGSENLPMTFKEKRLG